MASSEVLTLKNGFTVSLAVLRLAWNLEDRGFNIEPLGDRLSVQPAARLTHEDVTAIRRHRVELRALAVYVEHECSTQ